MNVSLLSALAWHMTVHQSGYRIPMNGKVTAFRTTQCAHFHIHLQVYPTYPDNYIKRMYLKSVIFWNVTACRGERKVLY